MSVLSLWLAAVLLAGSVPTNALEWFQQGRTQLKAGQHAEALHSFEQAQSLEPGLGTLLNIAECHLALGHDLEAFKRFTEARAWAERRREQARIEVAQARLTVLERRLARVELQPAEAEGLTLTLDGREVQPATPEMVVPGEVRVRAAAPGRQAWSATLTATAGQRLVVAVPALLPEVLAPVVVPLLSADAALGTPGADTAAADAAPRSRQEAWEARPWAEDAVAGLAVGGEPGMVEGIDFHLVGRASFEPRLGTGVTFALVGAYGWKGKSAEGLLQARIGWRYAVRLGPVWLGAGVEGAPALLVRGDGTVVGAGLAGVAVARLGVRVLLGGPFILALAGEGGGVVFASQASGVEVRPLVGGDLGVGVRF